MANDEEVDDFSGLESLGTRAEDARMGVGEQLVPPTGSSEDTPMAPTQAAEDPAAPAAPSQVAGSC
jgi:hypothetical protein